MLHRNRSPALEQFPMVSIFSFLPEYPADKVKEALRAVPKV